MENKQPVNEAPGAPATTQTPATPPVATPPVVPASTPTPAQLENVTINTTSVESKVGLYTKVTFWSLWILVIFGCGALQSLIQDSSGAAGILVFLVSVAIITTPIFIIGNSKRQKEIKTNPALVDDIFVKKYVRKNLFTSIVFTALSAFGAVFTLLSMLFLSKDTANSGAQGKGIVIALVWTAGFGAILAFCWKQHSRTTK